MDAQKEAPKKLKTWDEALSELKGFIIQSKKEEQLRAAAEKEKTESEQQP